MDPRAQYREQATSTASPAQLVLMLYDGALDELDRAELALDDVVDAPAAHDALVRAQRIVQELTVTLDHERGGQIATNLASLYAFVTEHLVEANLRKSVTGVGAARVVLQQLRETWVEACVVGQPSDVVAVGA